MWLTQGDNSNDGVVFQPMNRIFAKPSLVPSDRLPAAVVKRLGALSPWRFCLALALDVALIAAAIALSELTFFNPLAYLVSVVVIGARLHAFGILLHDCVHYRAFRTRKLNMIAGEALAWPLLITAAGYRSHHLTHHKYLNTLDDPDWVRKLPQRKFRYPTGRRAILWNFLYQFSGLGVVEMFCSTRQSAEVNPVPRKIRWLRLGFYLAVLGLCAATGTLAELALYWLVPMLTSFAAIFYLRSVAEHHGNLAYDHTFSNSRTTLPNAWERFVLMPHNVGYHLEHHLYPHVPFYRLPELHRVLMQQPLYAAKAHITRGVVSGLLREWVAPARGPLLDDIERQQQAALASVSDPRPAGDITGARHLAA